MKYCISCGNAIENDAAFCSNCGTAVQTVAPAQPAPQPQPAPTAQDSALNEEKTCLDTFYRFLKYERLAWKIGGFVMLGVSLLFLVLGFFMLLGAFAEALDSGYYYDIDTSVFMGVYGFMYSLYGLLFLPVAIVSLRAASRVDYYMDTLYRDAQPMMDRCGSVGMIVFCAFFNEVALAFFIVNFVRTKTCKNTLQNIINRQKNYHR